MANRFVKKAYAGEMTSENKSTAAEVSQSKPANRYVKKAYEQNTSDNEKYLQELKKTVSAHGTGDGRQTITPLDPAQRQQRGSMLSSGAFALDTAMRQKYGTYDNYLNDIRVDFESVGELEMQKSRMESSAAQQSMQRAQTDLEEIQKVEARLMAGQSELNRLYEIYMQTGSVADGQTYLAAAEAWEESRQIYNSRLLDASGKVEKSQQNYIRSVQNQMKAQEKYTQEQQRMEDAKTPKWMDEEPEQLKARMDELRGTIIGLQNEQMVNPTGSQNQTIEKLYNQYNQIKSLYNTKVEKRWSENLAAEIEAAGGEELMTALRNAAQLRSLANAEMLAGSAAGGGAWNSELQKQAKAALDKLPDIDSKQLELWLEYADVLNNKEQYEKSIESAAAYARENPVKASAASVPMNLAGGAGVVDVLGRKLGSAILGSNAPVNFQTAGMIPSGAASEIRETVSENMTKAGAFVYNLGMSMADSLAALIAGKVGIPGGSALLGGAAAASAMREADGRGATSDQAILYGLLAGGAEMFFEKYSIEKFLDMDAKRGVKNAVKSIFKQGLVETSEEGATTLANTLTDLLVMGDKNQLTQRKNYYMERGRSEKTARKLAAAEWFSGLLGDLAGGAISGGLFGVGGVSYQKTQQASYDKKIGTVLQRAGKVNDIVEQGMGFAPETTAHKMAEKLQKKLDYGKEISEREIGQMMNAIWETENGLSWEGNRTEVTDNETEPKADRADTGIDAGRERGTALGAGESIAQSAERREADADTGAEQQSQIQSYVKNLRDAGELEVKTQAEIGIGSMQNVSVAVVPESKYTSQMSNAAAKVRRLGVTFTVVADPLVIGNDGAEIRVVGYRSGSGIVVQANSRNMDIETITEHEIYHELARRDPKLVERTREALQSNYDTETLDRMYQKYEELYASAYAGENIDENLLAQKIYEEMLADAYAKYTRRNMEEMPEQVSKTVSQLANPVRDNQSQKTENRYQTVTEEDIEQDRRAETAADRELRQEIEKSPEIEQLKDSLEQGEITKEEYDRSVDNYIDNQIRKMVEAAAREAASFSIDDDPYTYEALVSKPDMVVAMLGERDIPTKRKKIDTAKIANEARQKALTLFNEEKGEQKYVYVSDLEANVLTPKAGFVHGIIGNKTNNSAMRTAEVTYDLVDIIKNSIAVNEKNPRTEADGEHSYILFGYAKRTTDGQEFIVKTTINHFGINKSIVDTVEIYDVLKGSKAKIVTPRMLDNRSEQTQIEETGRQGAKTEPSVIGSHTGEPAASVLNASGPVTISVADLLEAVKENYPELLPDDVRTYFEIEDIPKDPDMRYSVEENIPAGQQQKEEEPAPAEQKPKEKKSKSKYQPKGDKLTDIIRHTPGGLESYILSKSRRIQEHYENSKAKSLGDMVDAMDLDRTEGLQELVDSLCDEYMELGMLPKQTREKAFAEVLKRKDKPDNQTEQQFEDWAREDFEAAIGTLMSRVKEVRRYIRSIEEANAAPQKTVGQEKQIEELFVQLKEYRRTMEKEKLKNLLTPEDRVMVGRLLKGHILLEDVDSKKYNVRGIRRVFVASQAYDDAAKMIRAYNQARRDTIRKEAGERLPNLEKWKDKKVPLRYKINTMERNVYSIAPDEEMAKQLNDYAFKPVHEHEADATRLKNQMRERVKALGLKTGKPAKGNTVSESAAVQILGEAQDYVEMLKRRPFDEKREGKTREEWQATIANLWTENPNLDKEKIENAVKEFRQIYDQLFKMMNEARIRNGYEPVNYRKGYFPHFQQQDADGIIASFGKAFGITTEVANLPATINGMTKNFKPGIRWFGNALERLGADTTMDAVQGFDQYIEGVADVIYHTDDIQKLRALAQEIRYQASNAAVRERVNKIRENKDLNDTQKQAEITELLKEAPYGLSKFVVELEEYTNNLANKRSSLDRAMEELFGRNVYNIAKAVNSRVAANMVALNPGSWLTNFIPLEQGAASIGHWKILQGMWLTLQNDAAQMRKRTTDGFTERSTFLTNRRGSDRLMQTNIQKLSRTLSKPMEMIDNFVSESIVRGRYLYNLQAGMSQETAMDEADAWAAGIMADRSKGAMPTIFNAQNPFAKLFTQYQLEVQNTFGWLLKDLPREKRRKGVMYIAMAILKYAINAYLFNDVYEFFVGRRAAFDPLDLLLGVAEDTVGFDIPNAVDFALGRDRTFDGEQASAPEAISNAFTNIMEEVPFIGGLIGGGRVPISSALPNAGNLLNAATNSEWSTERRTQTALNELLKPALYILPPFGGGQIKKMYESIRAFEKHGSYNTSGNLQYPVFTSDGWGDLSTYATGLVFGKSSLNEAQEWVESGFEGLNEKYTFMYQQMLELGETDRDAWDVLKAMRDVKVPDEEDKKLAKVDILLSAPISDEAKCGVYFALLAGQKEKETMNILADADPADVLAIITGIGMAEDKEDKLLILRSNLAENEKMLLLKGKNEKEAARLEQASTYVDSVLYAEYLEKYRELHGDAGTSQERVQQVLDQMRGVTKDQKAALWQIANFRTDSKPESNPYNESVARDLIEKMTAAYADIKAEEEAEKEDGETEELGLSWLGNQR